MSLLKKTPPIIAGDAPYFLIFNGINTRIDFGVGIGITDLAQRSGTSIEFWVNLTPANITVGTSYQEIMQKFDPNTVGDNGFLIFYESDPGDDPYFMVSVWGSGTVNQASAWKYVTPSSYPQWYHAVVYITKAHKARVAINGVWGSLSTRAVVFENSDVNGPFRIGTGAYEDAIQGDYAGFYLSGSFGGMRISGIDRYGGESGTSFTPPLRNVTFTDDADTLFLLPMDDGGGTVRDISDNGNLGVISGSYAWGRGYG